MVKVDGLWYIVTEIDYSTGTFIGSTLEGQEVWFFLDSVEEVDEWNEEDEERFTL